MQAVPSLLDIVFTNPSTGMMFDVTKLLSFNMVLLLWLNYTDKPVGEMCRYLLTTGPSTSDKDHLVRLAYGNGMRPDVWTRFRERFGIKHIGELYAATEGNG